MPEQVLNGEADLGIAFNLPKIRGIRQIAAARFDVGVIMRPDHPLAKRPKLSLTDCIQYPICVADQSLSAGRLIEDAIMEVSAEVEPLIVCNSAEFLMKLVTSNLGIAFKSSLGTQTRDQREKARVSPPRKAYLSTISAYREFRTRASYRCTHSRGVASQTLRRDR